MNDGYRDHQNQPDTNDLEAARQAIRRGAEALHARAAFKKPVKYTDAESAAIARARIDARSKP